MARMTEFSFFRVPESITLPIVTFKFPAFIVAGFMSYRVLVRLQVEAGSTTGLAFSLPKFAGAFSQVAHERQLYSGLSPAIMRAFVYGGARLGLVIPLKPYTQNAFQAGALAGVLATGIGHPLEVLKVRLQATAMNNTLEPFRPFRGLHWAATRNAVCTMTQVGFYDMSKRCLGAACPYWSDINLKISSALIAAFFASTLTAPLDVLKTQRMAGATAAPLLTSIESCFRGWLANTIRLGPHTTFVLFLQDELQQAYARRYNIENRE